MIRLVLCALGVLFLGGHTSATAAPIGVRWSPQAVRYPVKVGTAKAMLAAIEKKTTGERLGAIRVSEKRGAAVRIGEDTIRPGLSRTEIHKAVCAFSKERFGPWCE